MNKNKITEEDWLILGMIHAFRSLKAVKEEVGSVDEVSFDYLIEIQKRNLSDPIIAEEYHEFLEYIGKENTSLEELK